MLNRYPETTNLVPLSFIKILLKESDALEFSVYDFSYLKVMEPLIVFELLSRKEAFAIHSDLCSILEVIEQEGFIIEHFSNSGSVVRLSVVKRRFPTVQLHSVIWNPSISIGIVAIRLYNFLKQKGYNVIPTGITDKNTPYFIKDIMNVGSIKHSDVSICLKSPWVQEAVDALLSDNRWGYLYHEREHIPEEMANKIKVNFSKVFTISYFCKDALSNSGIDSMVVPHGYDPRVHFPQRKSKTRWPKEFVFLSVAAQQKRKGTSLLVNSFIERFGDTKESVRLVLKDIPDVRVPRDLEIPKHPKITVISEEMTYAQVGALYREADCFVMPSKAEGFGIPFLEAKQSGIPVITTGWGGQTQFCHPDDTFLIDYHMGVRDDHFDPLDRSIYRWAIPDADSLVEQMDLVYTNPKLVKEKVNLSLERTKNLTWESGFQPILAALENHNEF